MLVVKYCSDWHIVYVLWLVSHCVCSFSHYRVFYFDSDGPICEQNPLPGVGNGFKQRSQLCATSWLWQRSPGSKLDVCSRAREWIEERCSWLRSSFRWRWGLFLFLFSYILSWNCLTVSTVKANHPWLRLSWLLSVLECISWHHIVSLVFAGVKINREEGRCMSYLFLCYRTRHIFYL